MIKRIILFLALPAAFLLFTGSVSAQNNVFREVCEYRNAGDSTVCEQVNAAGGANPLVGPQGILTTATEILSFILVIAAIIVIMLAGLKFITSGDNPQEVGKAREYIQYALLGLVLAAVAQAIVRLVLNRL